METKSSWSAREPEFPHLAIAVSSRLEVEKQRSRLDGWVQLSAEAVSGPTEYCRRLPVCTGSGAAEENIDDPENLFK